MKICYLLETTDLWGGVRVVFDQTRALLKRGHDVTIRALGGDHGWYPYDIKIDYVSDLSAPFLSAGASAPDVAVATFWTTVKAALRLNARFTCHLCQGYEGDSNEYASLRQAIEEAYRMPIPKLTIGRWLSGRLTELFGNETFEVFAIGQIVDLDMYRPLPLWRWRPSWRDTRQTRVLVSGLFDASVKAVPDALRAVSLLRERGFGVHLTRVSTMDTLARERAITDIDEYHCSIPPREMADVYRSNELFLAPSLFHEGFGLPFAEALACGTPAVATAIPSHMSFDESADYALFVPEKDPVAMAEAAIRILSDPRLRKRLIKRGIEVVNRGFRSDTVAEKLELAFSRGSI
jgi:glycosyltransferase involved in cell wall biosynthesis